MNKKPAKLQALRTQYHPFQYLIIDREVNDRKSLFEHTDLLPINSCPLRIPSELTVKFAHTPAPHTAHVRHHAPDPSLPWPATLSC